MSVSRPLSRITAALLLLSPLPGSAWAAPKGERIPSVSEVVVRAAPKVDELDVNGRWCPKPDSEAYPGSAPPRVVDSYPRPGATVAPGLLTVRATFDQPMLCSFDFDISFEGEDQPCEPVGVWTLPDRRTWTMRCPVLPGRRYKLLFAVHPQGFIGTSGRSAKPYKLSFDTAGSPEVATVADQGPPQQQAISGYVSCNVDTPSNEVACRHVRLKAPEEPTPAP